ncbi:thrombospondin type 3 repeat-containing protein [uncultured Mucilaginibacter sp.]|uniref:thrombospondin type 3 repeat-containing protein n=1 Tax=uncultured Mucilaginibacter sp. TaxID=797541 RepID=UPI0025DCBBEE|nr:thrombospondin type 3 repeat-containing protein [uncultured Mucilaginibacter sp.]
MKNIIIAISLLVSCHATIAQQLAFPGAEGFGRFATGGRGGSVYHVTNLDDAGPGSFRDAVSQPMRTVIFDVGGVINIKDKIKVAAKVTIAGQTAPGEGIVVYGNGVSFSGDDVVRYMRFRGSINMPKGACVVVVDSVKNVILDHISVEWGRWDDMHIKESDNVTVQYSIIGEPIDPQRFGALFENPTHVTIFGCLWIDNQSRNPKAKAGIEYINNVVYNWGVDGFVGGHSGAQHYQDVIGNYFIAGPNSGKNFVGEFETTDHVYQNGNYVDMDKGGTLNGRMVADSDFARAKASIVQSRQNAAVNAANIQSAQNAYLNIIATAGASLQRDAVDKRIIGYLTSLGRDGKIFKTEADAGGQGKIAGGSAPKDTDGDGIPDEWEITQHLNPNNPADGKTMAKGSGYTNLEMYLNSLTNR